MILSQIPFGGIATLIGAVGGFLTVCVSLTFQIINFRDQRRAKREQETHKALLCEIRNKVAGDGSNA